MKIEEVFVVINQVLPDVTVTQNTEDAWEINSEYLKLLIILSGGGSWLRLLSPIAAATEARSLFSQLLTANFDETQQVRYGLAENVLWVVFIHRLASLTTEDLHDALISMKNLVEQGLACYFSQLIEERVRQIVKAAKSQGQSLDATYQTLDRFYQEGILGGLGQKQEAREQFLQAWKSQLQRLWDEE